VAKWEYEISVVNDHPELVRDDLAQWASAGWELVSTSTWSWITSEGSGNARTNIWHVQFVHYWRRKIRDA